MRLPLAWCTLAPNRFFKLRISINWPDRWIGRTDRTIGHSDAVFWTYPLDFCHWMPFAIAVGNGSRRRIERWCNWVNWPKVHQITRCAPITWPLAFSLLVVASACSTSLMYTCAFIPCMYLVGPRVPIKRIHTHLYAVLFLQSAEIRILRQAFVSVAFSLILHTCHSQPSA